MSQPTYDHNPQPANPTHLGTGEKTLKFSLLRMIPTLVFVVGIVAWSQDWLQNQIVLLAFIGCVVLCQIFVVPRLARQNRRRRRAR